MKLILSILLLITITSCNGGEPSANEKQRRQTEKMTAEAEKRIGAPGITNFTERRFVKMLYELRDKEVTTYSYYLDMNGKKHFLCKSIGFGIPASVQFVNPEVIKGGYESRVTIPQPEPNGLYMPDSLSATYVMCINPKTQKVAPVYFEPQLIVSPFEL